ncbi:hypothetical protein [Planococcus alpniumensis]|uniref:hypothetical protein n=1 Tax=Planococcus alpniumensis TaxID=2708345 RepID=UPI001B8CA7DA|nr:hypothetical protein [Planococcus sp. MSAK28401]
MTRKKSLKLNSAVSKIIAKASRLRHKSNAKRTANSNRYTIHIHSNIQMKLPDRVNISARFFYVEAQGIQWLERSLLK